MPQKLILPILLVAALAAGALLLLDDDAGGPLADDSGAVDAASSSATLSGIEQEGHAVGVATARGHSRLRGVVRRNGDPVGDAFVGIARLGAHRWILHRAATDLAGRVHAPPVFASTHTDSDGSFAFGELTPGRYALIAGGRTARRIVSFDVILNGTTAELDIALPGGEERLHGRALHHDGRPFRGRLAVQPVDAGAWSFLSNNPAAAVITTTTSDGRFEVTGLEAGLYVVMPMLAVATEDHGPFLVPNDAPHVLRVDVATIAYAPTVRSALDGSPIHDAQVIVGPEEGPTVAATTDVDGAARMALSDVPSRIVIRAEGFVPVALTIDPHDLDPILTPQVRLWPNARIEGTVTDPTGVAVAGIEVFAYGESAHDFHPTPLPAEPLHPKQRTTTDARGRYAFDALPPGVTSVFAFGGGWRSLGLREAVPDGFNPLAVTAKAGETVSADLDVIRSPAIRGRVVDADGMPVADATVWPFDPATGFFDMTSGDYETHWFDGRLPAHTDADGRFVLSTVVPGTDLRLAVTAPGVLPHEFEPVRLTEDGTLFGPAEMVRADGGELLLRMPETGMARVRVVDARTSKPVPGALVSVGSELFFFLDESPRMAEARDRAQRAHSDADGWIRLPLDARESGKIQKRGYVDLSFEIDPGSELQLALSPARSITGSLSLPDDLEGTFRAPIAAYVGRHPAPERWAARGGEWTSIEGAVTDDEGDQAPQTEPPSVAEDRSVHVRHILESQTLYVMVRAGARSFVGHAVIDPEADGFVVEMEEVPPEEEEKGNVVTQALVLEADPALDLSRAFALPIPVRNGRPQPSHARRADLRRGRITAAFDPSVEAVVWYVLPGGSHATGMMLAAPVVHGPVPIAQAEVKLTLERGATRSGRVRADDGTAVRGARIFAVPRLEPASPAFGVHRAHAQAVTGPDGRFELRGLADLDYDLHLTLPPGFAEAKARPLPRGEAHVELTVNRAADVRIELRTPDGEPLPGATVSVGWFRNDDFEELARSTSDGSGMATLEGLDPGEVYELFADGYGHASRQDLSLSLADWTPRQTRLRTVPVPLGRLDVRNHAGERVRCTGHWRTPGRRWSWFSIDAKAYDLPSSVPADVSLDIRFQDASQTRARRDPAGSTWVAIRSR